MRPRPCSLARLPLTPALPRTLSDLDDTSIKLFLFGDAFAEHSKEHEGSLVCLLAPKVSTSNSAHDGGGPGFSLSVDKGAQLFKLGTAADFGLCKGERKDGRPCSMPVNKSVCEYCKYHAAAALKALDSRPPGRMDASGSARAMTERRRLMQAAGKGAGLHYAGRQGNSDWRQGPPPKPLATTEELKRVAECVPPPLCTCPLSCVLTPIPCLHGAGPNWGATSPRAPGSWLSWRPQAGRLARTLRRCWGGHLCGPSPAACRRACAPPGRLPCRASRPGCTCRRPDRVPSKR